MESVLPEQVPVLEDALCVTVWAMENHEADDALASVARTTCEDNTMCRAFVLTQEKHLIQVVQDKHAVQMELCNNVLIDENAVKEKCSVSPSSIVGYLGIVFDSADNISDNHEQWISDGATVRGDEKLATT